MPRHVRKKYSRFILWVETPFLTDDKIEHEEKCLIGHFHPLGNKRNTRGKKTIPQDHTEYTPAIIAALKAGAAEIVGIRPSDFEAPEDLTSETPGLMRRRS